MPQGMSIKRALEYIERQTGKTRTKEVLAHHCRNGTIVAEFEAVWWIVQEELDRYIEDTMGQPGAPKGNQHYRGRAKDDV